MKQQLAFLYPVASSTELSQLYCVVIDIWKRFAPVFLGKLLTDQSKNKKQRT